MIDLNPNIHPVSKVTIAGQEGFGVIWGGHFATYTVLFSHNSEFYVVQFTGEYDSLTEEEKEILGTFELL
jgi:hypothetical protein